MKNNITKILATIGLLIIIFILLKSFFGVGKAGFEKIKTKVSKSNLPTLECTFKDDVANSNYVDIFDLAELNDTSDFKSFPSNASEQDKKSIVDYNKNIEVREGSAWRITVLDDSYRIRFYNNKDRVAKGYYVDIKRKTGKAEMVFPVEHVADGTFQSHMDAVLDPLTKTFYGICSKIENKKL